MVMAEARAVMNEPLYKLVDQYAQKLIGTSNQTQWEVCWTTNGTFLECPINKMKSDQKMMVLVYNPSPVE